MFESGSALAGMVLLGLGMTLGIGGLAMILYSAQLTREAVAKRVDLVNGKGGAAQARKPVPELTLVRREQEGLTQQQQLAAGRLFGKFGVPADKAKDALLVARLISILIIAIAIFILAGRAATFANSLPLHFAVSLGFGIAGWLLPMMLIGRMVTRRAKAVVTGLPDALELLVICVEAGLAFEDGIDRVVGELHRTQPELSEELALTSADLKILPSRDKALANFAERIEMPSVRSVVTTLSQTMRYGTPLAQALRVVAGELRNDTLVRLEERANQLPAMMTIPMMIFIMPTIFMVVGGPAALSLMDNFHM